MQWDQVVLAIAVGGVILWAWERAAWASLPLRRQQYRRYRGDEEESIRMALSAATPAAGVYLVPGLPFPRTRDRAKQAAIDAVYRERVAQGPAAYLAVTPAGTDPRSPGRLAAVLVLPLLLSAAHVAILLLARPVGAGAIFATVLVVGAASWLGAHARDAVYFYFPMRYALSRLADLLVSRSLLGLWLAWALAAA
jgi:hypothetical protein